MGSLHGYILTRYGSIYIEHDKSLIRTDALRLYGSLRSTRALDGDDFVDLPTKSECHGYTVRIMPATSCSTR